MEVVCVCVFVCVCGGGGSTPTGMFSLNHMIAPPPQGTVRSLRKIKFFSEYILCNIKKNILF